MKAKDFDKKFDDNKQDIIDDLDLSTIKRPNQSQKRVNVDFPVWVIDSLDREASRVGVTRQSMIKRKRKSMDIHAATLDDIASICELADQVNTTHHQELPGLFRDPAVTEGSKEFWSKQLELENTKVFVASKQGSVVGFITARITENTELPFCTNNKVCRIGSIVVLESFQGKGIGGKLMGVIENWAKDSGAKDIRLEVMEFNKYARAFYARNGYLVMSRIMAKSIA